MTYAVALRNRMARLAVQRFMAEARLVVIERQPRQLRASMP